MSMTSLSGQLAAAVVAQLNQATFATPLVAELDFAPVHTLGQLRQVRVTVAPRGVERSLAARGLAERQLTVDIAIQQVVEPDDTRPAQVDQVIALAEAIADHLDTRRLGDAGQFAWLESQHLPLIPEQLLQEHVATSVVSVTYRHHRPLGTL